FAAVRNRGEIRRVGLDQKAVGWCHAGGFAHVFSRLERQDAPVAQVKSHIEGFLRLDWVAGETVHYARSGPVFPQDRHRVVPSFAGMDGDRQIYIAGKFQLLDENLTLDLSRREIVVVVQADFAECDHFRVGCKRAQIIIGLWGYLGRVMRVHTDRGVDLSVAVGQAHGPVDFRRPVAGPDGQDASDTRGTGPVENRVEIVGEALVIEMAVRVYEHWFIRGARASALPPTFRSARTLIQCRSIALVPLAV